MATKFPPPKRPFIKARYHGGSQTPLAIVIHGTVSSDNPGTALQIANWWHGPTSPVTSAHYVVDPKVDVQCVGDHTVAYHCGYNTGSIAIELCDEQQGPANRWKDADSKAILKRAARLVAELCLAYGIDPKRPTVAELRAKGPHGIYGHNDSRLAFGHTTHSDPRDFDWRNFLRLVQAEIVELKGGSATTGTKKDRMRPDAYFLGAKGAHVAWLVRRLNAHGAKLPKGRVYNKAVRNAVAAFQRAQGWIGADANGLPGPVTLRRLKAKPKPPKHNANDERGKRQFSVGEHNLHDETGEPRAFADVVLFCEAIVPTIADRVKARWKGRRFLFPKRQKDLVVLLRRKLFKVLGTEYHLAHGGLAKVTPHRGTYVVKTVHKPTGQRVAFVLEHRINAAFPPYKRGEGEFRAAKWRIHTDLTLGLIRELEEQGFLVIAGGDLNTPPKVIGYKGVLHEVSKSLDRIAASDEVELSNFKRKSALGSDHHRLWAVATLPAD